MTTKEILSQLKALKNDCSTGVAESQNWDRHTWNAMEEIVDNAIEHIEDQSQKLVDYSWETNPDRMGQ